MKLNERGMNKIRNAATGKLKITLAQLESKVILDDREMTVYEAVREELVRREK